MYPNPLQYRHLFFIETGKQDAVDQQVEEFLLCLRFDLQGRMDKPTVLVAELFQYTMNCVQEGLILVVGIDNHPRGRSRWR